MATKNINVRAERVGAQSAETGTVRGTARAPRWVVPSVKVALVVADAALAVASFVLAFIVREGENVLARASDGRLAWSADFEPYGALLLFVLLIRLLSLWYHDLYRLRGEFSYVDDCVHVFKATATASLLIVAAAFLYRGGFEFRAFSYARGVFVLDFFLALAASGLVRLVVRGAQAYRDHRADAVIGVGGGIAWPSSSSAFK